ncbi:MAG: hypothetical protein K2X27_24750 [Candidatus Obscuribacterales bacterium]|nr:hypothetical protein [Candidatus Obscuribacterales bacterium]
MANFESRNSSVKEASIQEAKELVRLYDGAGSMKDVDKKVHDRLLQDAIKSHHSELDFDLLRNTMKSEAAAKGNKQVLIKEGAGGQILRDNSLPVLSIIDSNNNLYDPVEGYKAMQDDDRKREAASQSKEKNSNQLNFLDGTLGLKTLFAEIAKATEDINKKN